MDDNQTLRSMVRDDAYRVVRVLSDGPSGRTELVTLDGEGPLVRKHIPAEIANASAWAVAMEVNEPLLPRIESLYRMPDEIVVVYEYVPGLSLSSMVEEQGCLPAKRAVSIVRDVCRAVTALHERGVVHRDITPGNVIVAQDGAHLVDLGIARQRIEGRRRDTNTLGTWGFAAPEQYGFAQTDARSDVYSLGRLLGYALTGVQPDAREYEVRLADASGVPAELAEVVYRATAFEPSARYQSAAELSDAAQAALDEAQASATSDKRAVGTTRDGAQARHDDLLGESFWSHEDAAGAQGGTTAQNAEPKPAATSRSEHGSQIGLANDPLSVFARAPFLYRVLCVFVWICCSFMAVLVLATLLSAVIKHEPDWGLAEDTMAIIVATGMLAMMREAWRLVSATGPYANTMRPLRSFFAKECIILFIICIGIFLTALVYAIVVTIQ